MFWVVVLLQVEDDEEDVFEVQFVEVLELDELFELDEELEDELLEELLELEEELLDDHHHKKSLIFVVSVHLYLVSSVKENIIQLISCISLTIS